MGTNIQMLEVAVNHLEPMLEEVVFVGGVICRFRHMKTDLILDVLPTKASILGFENRWQAEAFTHAEQVELDSGRAIRAIPPPFLLATKLEAFEGRGKLDFYESRDYEDIVRLIDGRAELPEEVATAPQGVRDYISQQLETASKRDQFEKDWRELFLQGRKCVNGLTKWSGPASGG